MLDEPSAGLSPKLVEMVFVRLADIRRSGVAIVLVEQNTRAARRSPTAPISSCRAATGTRVRRGR